MSNISDKTKKESVLFASLLPESIGTEIDLYFKKNGWTLLACEIDEAKGYQVFFGAGVQVDNLYEYGFPYLYDNNELMAFAKDFYIKKIIQSLESVHDAETFSFLGYNDFAVRLSDFFKDDNRFFDYAWAVSKSHENDSTKKDYIAYWDQGNGWCNVFGVFEGITQEQFVNELKNIQERSEQEKPELNNLIESASARVVEKDEISNNIVPER